MNYIIIPNKLMATLLLSCAVVQPLFAGDAYCDEKMAELEVIKERIYNAHM
jgi:hypothetical protein